MTRIFDDLDSHEVRMAHNQSIMRSMNEQVMHLHDETVLCSDFGSVAPSSERVCECANTSCMEQVSMTVAEYEAVRSSGDRFLVKPGSAHVVPDVENVTERHPEYWVVEKFGKSKVIADYLFARERGWK